MVKNIKQLTSIFLFNIIVLFLCREFENKVFMTLRDCNRGDKVWIHDPYSNMDSLVKIEGPYIENFREIGIKVCFADTMYLSWDILPFDEVCWIDNEKK